MTNEELYIKLDRIYNDLIENVHSGFSNKPDFKKDKWDRGWEAGARFAIKECYKIITKIKADL